MTRIRENYPKVYLYRRIVHAKLFIDNCFSEKIDLDNIADEAFFSKFHFIRLFRKIYRQSPHQYLTSVRIAKAKDMLVKGLPVTETCFAIGFDSLSSFTSLFKKRVGLSPSVYQAEALRIQKEQIEAPLNFVPNCFAESNGWSKILS